MRLNLLLFRFLLLGVFSFSHTAFSQEPPKKPNILFILTDDQRWDTIGCYGNKILKTPNLDKLCAQGARLDSFYVAAPLCCPSRAVFLTGLYPHQTGLLTNKEMDLPPGTKTVANHLNDAGYLTGFIGKAHLGGDPKKWGFRDCPIVLPEGKTKDEHHNLVVDGKAQKVSGPISTIFADSAIKFLQLHKDETWFLWLAMTAPHVPYVKNPIYKYDNAAEKLPPGWHSSWKFNADIWNRYYSTIATLDEQIGRVLDELERLGLAENTFVLMASDNGHMFGSHGVKDKSSWFEGAARVPGIVRWPGHVEPGGVIKQFVSSVDILPTLTDVAQKPVTANTTSQSILRILQDQKSPRNAVFAEMDDWQMVRKGTYKYVRKYKPEELYNIAVDPFELNNLAVHPHHRQILIDLKKELEDWFRRTPALPNAVKQKKSK